MISADIIATAQRKKAAGLRYVQLIVRRDRRPRTHRIRVAPGVLGVVIGETGRVGHYMVDVLIDDLLRTTQARTSKGATEK